MITYPQPLSKKPLFFHKSNIIIVPEFQSSIPEFRAGKRFQRFRQLPSAPFMKLSFGYPKLSFISLSCRSLAKQTATDDPRHRVAFDRLILRVALCLFVKAGCDSQTKQKTFFLKNVFCLLM